MSLGAPGGQGQDRIQAIEGLNRRFLIDGKYGRVLRRIEIQTDHVPLKPMRLQARPLPRALDVVVMDLQDPRELPRTPMGTAVRRALLRLGENPCLQRRSAFEIIVNDRLLAPNTPGTLTAITPDVEAFAREVLGHDGVTITPHHPDRRRRCGVTVRSSHPFELDVLTAAAGAGTRGYA
jgi:hypothetical protein